ncbi:FtsH-binding integral membrane protein [Clavibacter michiganensis]|uniref:hypothetical protein n=1 Tax=Clavibacter michiganensis TaxID=28447 RepID=UPI00195DF7ED|nr:hypothetical protein [Clavibacter michiganensis]MBM7412138.1 FtsH-binding integral membrane protein [Clavibacter michiganensis]
MHPPRVPSSSTSARPGTPVVVAAFVILLLGTLALVAQGLIAVVSGAVGADGVRSWVVSAAASVLLAALIGLPTRGDAIRRALGVTPDATILGLETPALVAGLAALLAVVSAIVSAVVGLPVAHIAGALAGTVGVGAASWILGLRAGGGARELRDGLRDGQPFPADIPWDRRAILARVLGVAGLGVLVIVVGAAVQSTSAAGGDTDLPVTGALISVGAAAVVAGVASMVVVFPASRILRPLVLDLDRPDQKRVLLRIRGTGSPLEPDHEWRAARLARACRIGEPFSSVGIVLILAGAALLALGASRVVPPDAVLALTAVAIGLAFVVVVAAGYLGSIYALLMRYSGDEAVIALAASRRPGAVEAERWPAPTGDPLG